MESVEAIFETIVANKTETGWMESVSNFFTGNVSGYLKLMNDMGEGGARLLKAHF